MEEKGKRQGALGAVRTFVADVAGEVKKTTWPGRQELFESTVVVIVSLALLSIYTGVCDHVLVWLLRLILPSG